MQERKADQGYRALGIGRQRVLEGSASRFPRGGGEPDGQDWLEGVEAWTYHPRLADTRRRPPLTNATTSEAGKLYLEDMGCQMNRMDSEIVLGKLRREGSQRVQTLGEADVGLYYTCSVRD